jgi:hypothetical protein
VKKANRQPVKAGPAGSLIVSPEYKLRGAARGKAKKRTKTQLRALAAGRRRSKADREAVTATGRKNAPEVLRAYDAAGDGDFGPLTRLSLRRQARASMLHDAALDAVEEDGLMVSEDSFDGEGRVVASRKKVHPAAEYALKSAEAFGLTADQQLMTPKARGVAKRDDRLAEFLDRQARIRSEAALNGPVADTEIVEEKP